MGLDVRAGVDTFKGFEAAAWECVMGWTLILISKGIDDLTPDGLPVVPLEPGGLLVLEPLSTSPLVLVLLVLGRELLAKFWAAEAEFWVEADKFWLDEGKRYSLSFFWDNSFFCGRSQHTQST